MSIERRRDFLLRTAVDGRTNMKRIMAGRIDDVYAAKKLRRGENLAMYEAVRWRAIAIGTRKMQRR